MPNEIKVFENAQFGKLNIMIIDGKEYFPATECAKILGYTEPEKAIRTHCKGVSKMDTPSAGGIQKKNYIPEGDLYRLIIRSKLPAAEQFERWVFDEVLPTLRKTGSYTAPRKASTDESVKLERVRIMAQNARSRQAEMWMKIAALLPDSPQHRQVCASYASEVLTGQKVIALPQVERTYSAEEVGACYGISANQVGRIANVHGLKTPENGMLVLDKSRHSSKEVSTWRYNEHGKKAIGDYL